jgi:hypothetical protein
MRVDMRDESGRIPNPWAWTVFDRVTGREIINEHIIAADDSFGQIIKYDSKDGKILMAFPLISEIRDIELVCTEWPK